MSRFLPSNTKLLHHLLGIYISYHISQTYSSDMREFCLAWSNLLRLIIHREIYTQVIIFIFTNLVLIDLYILQPHFI